VDKVFSSFISYASMATLCAILVKKIQEEGIELASLIKASNMYRRSKPRNIVTDYIPPTDEEKESFNKAHLEYVYVSILPSYVGES